MTTQALTTTDTVLVGVPMMDQTEARAVVTRIKTRIEDARRELLELHDREGWRALGYSSWGACAKAEFGGSAATLYRQLEAAEIARDLGDSQFENLPTSQLQAVKGLPPDQGRQALEQAHTKTQGKPTARDVQAEVDAVQGTTPLDLQRRGVQLTRHGSWFKATGYSGVMNGWTTPAAQPYDRTVEAARAELARRTAAAAAAPAEAEYEDVQARLAKHGTWLTRKAQGGTTLYVTRQDGKEVGIATPTWSNVLSRLEYAERSAAPAPEIAPAEPPHSTDTALDDQAMIADIRALAEPLDLQMMWENGKVLLYWPGEEDEIEQMDLLSYGAALEWLKWEAPGIRKDMVPTPDAPAEPSDPAASDRQAHIAKEQRDAGRLERARSFIAAHEYDAARTVLSAIEVSTWDRDKLLATIPAGCRVEIELTAADCAALLKEARMFSSGDLTTQLPTIGQVLILLIEAIKGGAQ
jgi:hypothetical protein